jgi:hypothetical protein
MVACLVEVATTADSANLIILLLDLEEIYNVLHVLTLCLTAVFALIQILVKLVLMDIGYFLAIVIKIGFEFNLNLYIYL